MPWPVVADVRVSCGAEGTKFFHTSLTPSTLIYFFQAIEHVTPEQQAIFVEELSHCVLRCVKDANGNHVGCSYLSRACASRY